MQTHEIEQMLAQTVIGRLAMADGCGRPYVIPLPFTWTDGALYLRVPMTGRKGQVLLTNNKVCFELDRFTNALDDYASVLIEGRLEQVRDVSEKQRVREVTREKYQRLRGGNRPGHGRQTPIEEMPLCKVIVDKLSGRKRSA